MPRLSTILGPDGRLIDRDELFGPPKAGPTLTGVRSPISGHPAYGLTPSRLAAIHLAAAQGDPLAYLELAEDIEERDLHYAAVMATRKRAVAQLPVTVEAASDAPEHVEHADFVRDWLDDGVLDAALFDMADAIGKGFSVLEIEWDSRPKRVVPRRLAYRPQRWFAFDDFDGDTPMILESVGKAPLAPHKFIVHRHPSKSGLTIRTGLARVASWAWMYKAFTIRDWAIFVQNHGQPIRVGRYDGSASDADKEVLWRAVANIAGDTAAILPKGMEIEFVEVKNNEKGADLYERRADWLDRQISKLVLGQTTTTDAVSGGHAVAQEHRLVQEDIERADAKLTSATLTRQLVPFMVAFNYGPQEHYPRLRIGRPDEVPLKDIVDAIDKLGEQGLEVEHSQILDRLGLTEAAKGAKLIGGRRTSPAGEPRKPGRDGDKPTGLHALRGLVSHHASAPEPEFVERMTARLAEDAAGAVAGMTAEIRRVFEESADLAEAAERLGKLDLDKDAFVAAMTRGVALAHLAGQAALLDELKP